MRKYINVNTIKLERKTIANIKEYCIKFKYKATDMFMYTENGEIFVGFSADTNTHIAIHNKHWKPVHEC